jgi:hypothetical protein
MKQISIFHLFIGAVLLQAACTGPAPADGERENDFDGAEMSVFELTGAAPADVREFIIRRAGCNHFWGEVSGDSQESDPQLRQAHLEREAQIQQALDDLDCDSLDDEAARLQTIYASNGALIGLMREIADALGWPADHN